MHVDLGQGVIRNEMRKVSGATFQGLEGQMKGLDPKSTGPLTKGLYFCLSLHWLQAGSGGGRTGGQVTERRQLAGARPGFAQ